MSPPMISWYEKWISPRSAARAIEELKVSTVSQESKESALAERQHRHDPPSHPIGAESVFFMVWIRLAGRCCRKLSSGFCARR